MLIDNRIDEQWLFAVLNTWLMCPTDSAFVLIADANGVIPAKKLLERHAPALKARVLDVNQLVPGTQQFRQASTPCSNALSSGGTCL